MSSLFNQSQANQIIERINQLSADTKAQWGKMSVTQMLAHSQPPLKVATGDLKLKRGLIGFLFGGIAKKQLLADHPFKKNLPTSKEFLVKDHREFEVEKQKLISLINEFQQKGKPGLSKDPHPFFGKLTPDEWDLLQWKHLDHHLRQFGV